MNKYGDTIRKARIKKGYSQEKLAENLYISKQSVSKYENNLTIPSEDIKNKLEELLGIKLLDTKEILSISNNRLKLIFSTVVAILFIGIVALSINLINVNKAYSESVLEYQQLLVSYQELNDQGTLDYYGIYITYTDNYSVTSDYFIIDLVVHNSTDSQYLLNAELFTIYDLYSGNNRFLGENIFISKGIVSNETYVCRLRFDIAMLNEYLNQSNYIDVFYAQQFITRINLENNA
jgi:transcriptional regulator with XRE-family HTH domain